MTHKSNQKPFGGHKKVLSQLQSSSTTTTTTTTGHRPTSPSIEALRCRCAKSRRISNILIDCERRNRKRMILYREYRRLRDCVPTIAHRNVSKLTIINEAVNLISQLELAVIHKLQAQGSSPQTLSKHRHMFLNM
ncbi:uncharacterized protein LOC128958125 [Oppia nitens]|uniref:uncharacterized protein LOC128958125 n=1 Tax=Oppia nitens TaxID=1686743 RepID=UPI0023DC75C4|nr:uncharacterized protein LOC128958125 [Oppia nitens]